MSIVIEVTEVRLDEVVIIRQDDDDVSSHCHVYPDGHMTTFCGLNNAWGLPRYVVIKQGTHRGDRCGDCGKPICLTCALLAGINVKGDE